MGFLTIDRTATRLETAGLLTRAPVAPATGVGGEPPTPRFIATCQKARAGPYQTWLKYRERCTGIVPWNLPGRGVEIPVVGAALPVVAGLVPGGQTALKLFGGAGMNGGFEQPIGIGIPGTGIGAGICPTGTQCVGPTVAGICLGSCVTVPGAPAAGLPAILPPQVTPTPTRQVYTDPTTGQVVAVPKKRRRMNYSNQKALRRALRRATGYARQQKAVRKAAQEFAREFGPKTRRARRDVVVPRHTLVR